MKNFLKKNYLLIPVLVILIFIGTVFSSKYARFNTLASIINAQQLLNTNYNTFNAKQKLDFIKEIDNVLTFLGNENKLLKQERFQTLNSRQIEKQTELDVSNQKLSKATSELSNLTNNLNSLNSRLKTLNDSRSETNKQCNRLRSAQRVNCRNKLNTIDTNIRNVRNQISSTQNSINNSRSNLNNAQIEVNTKNTELRQIIDKINDKQAEIDQLEQTIARLSQFRVRVMNSSTNNDVTGCTDSGASNYNPNATVSDGSCLIPGCMNQMASNFNPNANTDDGSCLTTCENQETEIDLCSFQNMPTWMEENDVNCPPPKYWEAVADPGFEKFKNAVILDTQIGPPSCGSVNIYSNATPEQKRNWYAGIIYGKQLGNLIDKNKECAKMIDYIFWKDACGIILD